MDFGSSHVYIARSSFIPPPAARDVECENTPKAPSGAAALCDLEYDDVIFTVKNVYNFTEDVVDWNGLGLQLKVAPSRLKKISQENKTVDGSRRDMISRWMNSDPEASWEKLSEALVRVDHRALANKVNKQVVPLLQQPPPKLVRGQMKKRSSSVACDYAELAAAPKPVPTQRNTNVLMMNFGALSKPCSVHTGDPVICSNDQCAAILSHISEIKSEKEGDSETKVWMCEFCSTRNVIDIAMEEVPKQGEILYLQEVERSSKDKSLVSGITKDSIVVFCVDTSGSMGQTTEIPRKLELKGYEKLQKLNELYFGSGMQYMPGQSRNVTYVSRLQCVQAAIDHQLNMLAINNPSQRVAVVTFGNEVTVIGDGKPENKYFIVGEKLWKENALLKLIEDLPTPSPIKETKDVLSKMIYSIEDEGQTALGGALLVSVEIAKHAPGSKVILCTDGLANRGIGSLDDVTCAESSISFYKKLGMTAKEASTSVSVLTIKGTECDLYHLGQVASLSGGSVDIVDPLSITDEFVNILSNSVVAVNANAKLILHSTMYFKDGDKKNTLQVPVGNVMDTTEFMYEFDNLEESKMSEVLQKDPETERLPFQVQVRYKSLDGQQCLRVITDSRPVTSDITVANQGSRDSVLRAFQYRNLRKSMFGEHRYLNATMQSGSARPTHKIRLGSMKRSMDLDSKAEYSIPLPNLRAHASAAIPHGSNRVWNYAASNDLEHVCERRNNSRILDARTQSGIVRESDNSICLRAEGGESCTQVKDVHAAQMFKSARLTHNRRFGSATKMSKKTITLTNEGYGFGFTVSHGKEGETIVQSLIPDGVAWKDGKLQKGDTIIMINDENVKAIPHQEVVQKLRELNEDADSICLCVNREEDFNESEDSEDEEWCVTLESEGPGTLGLSFKFDDLRKLRIDEIQPEGIAAKNHRLRVQDRILQINGEDTNDKTDEEILAIVKDIEENNSSLELLISRQHPTFPEHPKSMHMAALAPLDILSNQLSDYLEIKLSNEGCGFGFAVQKSGEKSITIRMVLPGGIASKDGRLSVGDKLLEINGRKVADMTYQEVVTMLKDLNDEDDSTIELKVQKTLTV